MKLQDMVDEGKMSPGTVPQTFRNKNQTMPQIEISINGILKLLYNLKPVKVCESLRAVEDVLKPPLPPPGSLLATDRSKAVVLV